MPPSEIRKEARQSLKGKWGKAICIILAFFIFSMIIGFVQGLVGEETLLYNLIEIAYLIIEIPLTFGIIISFIKLKRDEEISAFAFLKEGFSRFKKSWGISLHTLLRMLLPIACFIVLMVLFFTMNFFFIASSITGNTIASSTRTVLYLIFTVLEIASVIYIVSRSLLYVLGYYISYDNPELTSKECVKKSEAIMKGNRGNYFLLELSFIGWAFLTLFTFGIGMLWLAPYMQIATVCFYEKILKNKEIKQSEPVEKVEE